MPSPSDFAHANLDEVVESLTLDEAISLVAGVGWWQTAAVPRLNIPSIKVCDLYVYRYDTNPLRCRMDQTALEETSFTTLLQPKLYPYVQIWCVRNFTYDLYDSVPRPWVRRLILSLLGLLPLSYLHLKPNSALLLSYSVLLSTSSV